MKHGYPSFFNSRKAVSSEYKASVRRTLLTLTLTSKTYYWVRAVLERIGGDRRAT